MALLNRHPNAPLWIPLGRKGEAQSKVNGTLVGAPYLTRDDKGRHIEVAPIVIEKITLSGEVILQERPQNLYFAFDRHERVESLDGTPDAPRTAEQNRADASAMLEEFIMSGRMSAQTVTADEIAV